MSNVNQSFATFLDRQWLDDWLIRISITLSGWSEHAKSRQPVLHS
jgi:hypothetical protein